MSDLLVLATFKSFLTGTVADTENAVLISIFEGVEAQFLTAAGRGDLPFIAATTARVEIHDGTGTERLYLDYQIASATGVTSILIGQDPATPTETLDPTDIDVISYSADSRQILRTDGGRFARAGRARVVQVTYDHAADLPDDARLAILRVAAQVYEQRGREDAKTEKLGDLSSAMAHLITDDPIWSQAVARHSRLVLV